MSSDGDRNGIPSNEEIIEELTKDLKSSAIKNDSCDDDNVSRRIGESDSDDDTRIDEAAETKDEDYIDDNLLKERDEQLSDEKKRVNTFLLDNYKTKNLPATTIYYA